MFSALLQLADFHAGFPDIQPELSLDDSFVDILGKGLDPSIRLANSVAQDTVSVKISEREPIAILGSPGYLARRGAPKRAADPAANDCIRFRFPGSGAVFRWELLDEGRPLEMEVKGPVTVNNTGSMLACAREGLGFAYVLEHTAGELVQSGSRKRVLASASPCCRGSTCTTRAGGNCP